jgi:ABC-type nitrate/sulfonate/bicarbonate transport system permease component
LFFGGFLGLLAGLYKGFASYLRRLIAILQSIPPITWLPFLMIIYGFGHLPIIVIVTIASFFPSLIAGEMVAGTAVGLGFATRFAGEIADMSSSNAGCSAGGM